MKLIPLTRGKFVMVDDEDYEWLNQWKWYAQKMGNTYYATRAIRRKEKILMHRLILDIIDPKFVGDHKDRNGLNCQRNNLRKATYSQNGANRILAKNSSSKYLGVFLFSNRTHKKTYYYWRASIRHNGKQIHLGTFKTEEIAASAYNAKANELHGEFARLNIVV